MSADDFRNGVCERYLDLLKRTLTFTLWPEPLCPIEHLNEDRPLLKRAAVRLIASTLRTTGYQLARDPKPAWADRRDGASWPYYAGTMMGLTRLAHLQHCVETVCREDAAHQDAPTAAPDTGFDALRRLIGPACTGGNLSALSASRVPGSDAAS